MTRKIIVSFAGVRADDMELISRIRDLGEDLSFELRGNGQGDLPLEESDRAVDRMIVKTVPRFTGEVTQRIRQLLRKYHPAQHRNHSPRMNKEREISRS